MKMIRTTVTLPEEAHLQLRQEAFKYNKSLNQVIVDRLYEKPEREYSSKSIDEKTAETLAFFQKIGKMGKQIDLEKAIREDRDRDHA